jgi:Mrp family chromosome partitioning ATPase
MSESPKTNSPKTDDDARQTEELELRTRMAQIERKILVLSGKGGVGKSNRY